MDPYHDFELEVDPATLQALNLKVQVMNQIWSPKLQCRSWFHETKVKERLVVVWKRKYADVLSSEASHVCG